MNTLTDALRHFEAHRAEDNRPYVCDGCGELFDHESYLTEQADDTFLCADCDPELDGE